MNGFVFDFHVVYKSRSIRPDENYLPIDAPRICRKFRNVCLTAVPLDAERLFFCFKWPLRLKNGLFVFMEHGKRKRTGKNVSTVWILMRTLSMDYRDGAQFFMFLKNPEIKIYSMFCSIVREMIGSTL